MKVAICSRAELTKLLQQKIPEETAIICFCDSLDGTENLPIPAGHDETMVFRIVLDDIDIEELAESGLSEDTFFPEAEELAQFIYRAHDKKLNLICQCEYGQSRSAACGAAILEHFCKDGISIFRDYRYTPNKLIFNKVYEALRKVAEVDKGTYE